MKKLIIFCIVLFLGNSLWAQSYKFKKGVESSVPIITPSNNARQEEETTLITAVPYIRFMLENKPYKVTITSDGDYMAVVTKSGEMIIFDLTQKSVEFSSSFSPSPLYAAHFHPSKRIIALGDRDGIITVFDMVRRDAIKIIYELSSSVSDLKFSPDGTILAAVHFGGDITFYETESYSLLDKLDLVQGSIYWLCFNPSSTYLATGNRDNTVKVLETGASQPLLSLNDHQSFVITCDFSQDNWLASGAADSQLFVYQPSNTGWDLTPYFSWIHGDWVTAVKFHLHYLFTGCKDGKIRIFDFRERKLLATLDINAPILGIDIQQNYIAVITPKFAEIYQVRELLDSIY
ncbi:MAG: hypothetical protein JXD21_03175 [Candidatus Omnitrophica bacterium]|nr:hypothetical protein [Candidatus Omnitrophota bacterium]